MNGSDIIIVGAGPAGMLAAITAAERGRKVLLLEKNQTAGKKLLLCGKKRCNVTNAERDLVKFSQAYLKNEDFMLAILKQYSNLNFRRFIEDYGQVPLKEEIEGRLFPKSNKAEDILNVFLRRIEELNIEVLYETQAIKILTVKDRVVGVETSKGNFDAPKVLISTGGISVQRSGSTGEGLRMAKELGHNLVDPRLARYPFEIAQAEFCRSISGLILYGCHVSFSNHQRSFYSGQGEVCFKNFGLAGPALNQAFKDISTARVKDMKMKIDSFESSNLVQLRNQTNYERIKTELEHITGQIFNVKNICLVNKRVATDGGVPIDEIDRATLESKIVKGLYFAGEILDVIGKTGGYNLQAAWSTGYVVGESV